MAPVCENSFAINMQKPFQGTSIFFLHYVIHVWVLNANLLGWLWCCTKIALICISADSIPVIHIHIFKYELHKIYIVQQRSVHPRMYVTAVTAMILLECWNYSGCRGTNINGQIQPFLDYFSNMKQQVKKNWHNHCRKRFSFHFWWLDHFNFPIWG